MLPFEHLLERFEYEWQQGRPNIGTFAAEVLADVDPKNHAEFLHELVALDLECRWRATAQRVQKRSLQAATLETYVKWLKALGTLDQLPDATIAEEYRVRLRWGDRPPLADYQARFPRHGESLFRALLAVEHELKTESPSCLVDPIGAESIAEKPIDARPRKTENYSDYRLMRLIGRGGMAHVYAGVHKPLQSPVAVKVLRKEFWALPHAHAVFRHEADMVASLQHPQIVAAQGMGPLPGGGYFLVLELVIGRDFSRLRGEGLATHSAIELVRQAANVVDVVHRQGVIHCDLKPSNLLLGVDGRVRITDFGLARRVAGEGLEHIRQPFGGTLQFMAPEQLPANSTRITPAVDIYGLGGVLLFLLTGEVPNQLQAQTLHSISVELRDIIRRSLAANPDERFATAVEMAAALAQLG